MKVLLVHQYFLEPEDAGGSRFNEMTKVWAEQGHDIFVLAGMVNGATGVKNAKYNNKVFVKDIYGKNLTVLRCYTSSLYNTNYLGRLWSYFSYMFFASFAGLFLTNRRFDIILTTSPPLFVGLIGIFLSKIKRIPYVFEVRDLWPESAIDTGVLKNRFLIGSLQKLEKLLYRNAELIVVLTPAFMSNLIHKKGVPEERIIYIPNGADFSLSDQLLGSFDTKPLRESLKISNNFVITYVGAHGVANHLIQLIEAAELLKTTDVLFLLIGDGMEKSNLKNRISEKQLSNVLLLDPVPKQEIFKFILASDMGVSVLKKADIFKTIYSNKTFDYMACKKPVLMVIDGISRDLIEEADCGIYAEPENVQDIVQKINEYRDQADLIEQGENGYNFVKQNFDRRILSDLYLERIKSIIND